MNTHTNEAIFTTEEISFWLEQVGLRADYTEVRTVGRYLIVRDYDVCKFKDASDSAALVSEALEYDVDVVVAYKARTHYTVIVEPTAFLVFPEAPNWLDDTSDFDDDGFFDAGDDFYYFDAAMRHGLPLF